MNSLPRLEDDPYKRFRHVTSFNLLVPKDYDCGPYVGCFGDGYPNPSYGYEHMMMDSRSEASACLGSIACMTVDIFQIQQMVTSPDCRIFLKKCGARLIGIHSLLLAHSQAESFLSPGFFYISFAPEDQQRRDRDKEAKQRLPLLYRRLNADFKLDIGYLDACFNGSYRLLCTRVLVGDSH